MVLGRPNAGKSTLVNRLLGENRMLTGPEPGITRDAITLPMRDVDGREFQLVDTAGAAPPRARSGRGRETLDRRHHQCHAVCEKWWSWWWMRLTACTTRTCRSPGWWSVRGAPWSWR